MSNFPDSQPSNINLIQEPFSNAQSDLIIDELSLIEDEQGNSLETPAGGAVNQVPEGQEGMATEKSKANSNPPTNLAESGIVPGAYQLSDLNYHTSLKERIGSLVDGLKFADVTFVLSGDGDETIELRGHKLILAISSPVFAAMFYGALKCEDRVIITDCKADAFENMLQFAYKNELSVTNTQLALDVLYAARKYSMRLLEDECMIYLCAHVTHESVLAVKEAGEKYHFPILESICEEYIEQNSYKVLKYHYPFLPIDSLEQFISSDHLNIQEVELFRILLDWASLECERFETEETPLAMRKLLEPVIHEIRFPLMTAAEMADSVVPTGILSTEEIASILTYISATDKHGVTQVLGFPTRSRVQKRAVILSSSTNNSDGGSSFSANSGGYNNANTVIQIPSESTWIGRSPRNHARSKRKNRSNR